MTMGNDIDVARQACMEKLRKVDMGDPEYAHGDADRALRDFLLALGYDDIVDLYDAVPKWYA